jgi:hypothetical protein
VARKRWTELDPRVRQLLVVGGAVEGVLKVAALVDLYRRPAHEVRGPKWRWATVITLVNAVGAVPAIYFRYGRRR